LSIQVPIIQAPRAPDTSAQFFAAVPNAGGVASSGTALHSIEECRNHFSATGIIREARVVLQRATELLK
jgi:NAD(P)H-dependent flavin oxidoreductase YrpB (nitropropane dioxygenase family)